MASVYAGAPSERPSYSMIAASGLKPAGAQHTAATGSSVHKSDSIASQQSTSQPVTSSTNSNIPAQAFTPKPKKLVALATKEPKSIDEKDTAGPQVHVHDASPEPPPDTISRGIENTLSPSAPDDVSTQMSSGSSGKPPSLGGKSAASGTTFALDEKESLRPDDSASVKATEDEEAYLAQGSQPPVSCSGSDDGVRAAFHHQLRDLPPLEMSNQLGRPPVLGHGGHMQQGYLYVPPEGSGVGMLMPQARHNGPVQDSPDLPPDPKLLEALESPKDRIMVLKLEQDLADFVKDSSESFLTLPQTNAFYRMLAHKLADYYMLGHHSDETTSAVRIFKRTTIQRLPPPLTLIATPSTAASTPPPVPPQMKILRRGVDLPTIANGSGDASKTGSETGESGTEGRKAKIASREEREAKYEEARKRIMGSAKPSESPEAASAKDDSRSSSVAGKKSGRRKNRAESDDDFEVRSAYSAYYPPAYGATGNPPTYSFTNSAVPQTNQYPAQFQDGGSQAPISYSPYSTSAGNPWPASSYNSQPNSSMWMQQQQSQQTGFDLSSTFQRAMSLQFPPAQSHSPNIQQGYALAYAQQYPAQQQQQWPQSMPYASMQAQQMTPSYSTGFGQSQPQPSSMYNPSQPYQYGQLPSQAFPGRPPNKLEHPLPGSYKGNKHFNVHSTAFVPGSTQSLGTQSFASHAAGFSGGASETSYNVPYGSPQRQQPMPSPYNSSAYQQSGSTSNSPLRGMTQPMVHPLPQPVFPQQPSPSVPLPPKPHTIPNATRPSTLRQHSDTITKWPTPASLPAKPPPSQEPFDPTKFMQGQRQMSNGSSRGGMPTFGAMPQLPSPYGAPGMGR